MKQRSLQHIHLENDKTYLLGEERCKRLKLTNIAFVEGKQQLLNPFMGCSVQRIQYWVHELQETCQHLLDRY